MTSKRETKKNLVPPYCEVCKYDKYVTRHRIRPGKKGGKYRAGNVVGLCPNCHIEAELGLLSPLILLKIVYKRMQLEMKKGK
jgi:hypothetical protein